MEGGYKIKNENLAVIAGFFCCLKTLVFYIKTIDKYCFLLYNMDNTRSVFI